MDIDKEGYFGKTSLTKLLTETAGLKSQIIQNNNLIEQIGLGATKKVDYLHDSSSLDLSVMLS